jgi:DNA-binding MarR family transcriptional regulator
LDRLRARTRSETGLGSSQYTRSQLVALNRIVAGPPMTSSDLAAAEYVRPQSMAQTLAPLEEAGLVTRSKDPNDGRRILLSATPLGHEVLQSAVDARDSWLALAIEHGLTAEEKASIPKVIQLLDHLTDCQVRSVPPRFRENRESVS